MSKKSQRDMGDAFGGFLNESAADASNRILNVPEAPLEFNTVNSDKIRYIDILHIEPDPMQPRRAIPHDIRAAAPLTAADMPDFLQHWAAQTGIDIRKWLERSSDEDRPEPDSPAQAALLALIDFAASIRRDGLLNAITVVSIPGVTDSYAIETGERRWLAFHVLHLIYGNEYQNILGRVMPQRDVWRQAIENNVRENLTAIARARQLAILLMDLHGMINFRPLSAFAHEQDFYAQVADGNKWPAPTGKTEQLFTAMKLKSGVQLRQYRALLRLPHEAWSIADDKNIAEYALRSLQTQAGNDIPRLIKLVKDYTVSGDTPQPAGDTVSTDTRSDDDAGNRVTPSQRGWIDKLSEHSLRSNAFWEKAKGNVDKLSAAARLQLRTAAEQERALLDELIAKLEAKE